MSWAADHLIEVVLPWWERHGADDVDGGVWSCFSNDGHRQSSEKYTWSQGRWAWLCAELAREADAGRLPVDGDRWRRRSIETASFLTVHAVRADHRTVFRTDTHGAPLAEPGTDAASSVFADLFVALGLAGAAELEPGHGFAEVAAGVLTNADTMINRGDAPMEPYPVPAGFTDLASAMSLLHAGSEVGRLTGRPEGRSVARAAADRLATRHLRDADWWEYAPDADRDTDTLLARHRTPGHLLECLWMLLHASDVDSESERADLSTVRLAAVAVRALEIGWDDQYGGVFRYVEADGGPPHGRLLAQDRYQSLVADTWDTKLWWVHVEALYATALLADRLGAAGSTLWDWHRRIRDWSLSTFPSPGAEWIQIRGRTGQPLDRVVALPVKDPFHIARALLLLNRLPEPPTDTPATDLDNTDTDTAVATEEMP